ncbi:MAG: hypothetical protein AB7O31_03120 [Burkholderiales bacterium]
MTVDEQDGGMAAPRLRERREEVRLKLEEHWLVMYAGVMPHLLSTKGITEPAADMRPFAVGHGLYLDTTMLCRAEKQVDPGCATAASFPIAPAAATRCRSGAHRPPALTSFPRLRQP